MLHIHKLSDLTPRNVEIECVSILRQIRNSRRLPVPAEALREELDSLLITPTDLTIMKEALELIPPVKQQVTMLLQRKDALYETINLQRTVRMMEEISSPLQKNLHVAEAMQGWQQEAFIPDFTAILNQLPRLRTPAEKQQGNDALKLFFRRLLRTDDFRFAASDIIHEAQVTRMNDLDESLHKGFFFHVSLEEELKKMNFERIKLRISPPKLQEAENLHQQIKTIRRGVERAYEGNKRVMELAVLFYAYVKWAMGK